MAGRIEFIYVVYIIGIEEIGQWKCFGIGAA